MPNPLGLPRPQRLAFARRRRVGMRLASGLPTSTVARAEGIPEAEVSSVLTDPAFADLIAAYRTLDAMPRDERVARLAKLAWRVLELALADGDVRAAIFVASTVGTGRDPAEVVAETVATACERAASLPPTPAVSPPTPFRPFRSSLPRDPVPGIIAGATTSTRNLLAAEYEAITAADSPAAPRRPLTRRPPVPKPRAWWRKRRQQWLWRNRRRAAAVPRREAPS